MSNNGQDAAPGWYDDGSGRQRWWDGTQWTEHFAPTEPTVAGVDVGQATTAAAASATSAVPPATYAAAAPGDPAPKKKSKKGWIIGGSIAAGILVIGGIGGALGAGGDKDDEAEPVTSVAQEADEPAVEQEPEIAMVDVPDVVGSTVAEARSAAESAGISLSAGDAGDQWVIVSQDLPAGEVEDTGDVVLTVKAEKPLTLGQQNAVSKAQDYLAYTAFSRSGLIEQLVYEGFSKKDATFAVDYIGVDWRAQAVIKAQDYLDYTAFSRSGLIEQLKYEGFSTKQATFAVDNITVKWKEQAAIKAQDYLDYSSFSRQGLIDQLLYEGFTQEQAEYGVKAVGY